MYLLAYDLEHDKLTERAWLDYLVRVAPTRHNASIVSWVRQPWGRPPNCQSWISTLVYSLACT
jgi:hypothetical protein